VKFNFERWGETILGAVVAVVAVGFFAFAAAQAGQNTTGAVTICTRAFSALMALALGRTCAFLA